MNLCWSCYSGSENEEHFYVSHPKRPFVGQLGSLAWGSVLGCQCPGDSHACACGHTFPPLPIEVLGLED